MKRYCAGILTMVMVLSACVDVSNPQPATEKTIVIPIPETTTVISQTDSPPETTTAETDETIELPFTGVTYTVPPPPIGRPEELQVLITPKAQEPLSVDYFDNCMFIGDSIITGFNIWKSTILVDNTPLNNSYIFAVSSYSANNAAQPISNNSYHPLYEGEQIRPEDIIREIGVQRVFISLGLNDMYTQKEVFVANYTLLLSRIIEKNPDVEIIILSISPYLETAQPAPDRNAMIMEYNNELIMLANRFGIAFIDSAAVLREDNGGLKPELCGDTPPVGMGCHWAPGTYALVLQYILEHPPLTEEQKNEEYKIIIAE
ncbi:MAG: GDSL-type esterase/lipase family protein [Oscillospiraceae bacterium]|nr:GDSL-type esterase/lipase family protein [Oscillospiraceae bacterium]